MTTTVNVRNKDKVRLFNTISVEFGSKCNRHCSFCPNYKSSRPNEFMPEELLDKIFNELAAIKYKGRITTYNYNEPLLDKRLHRLVKKYSSMSKTFCFMVATNGDLLRNKDDVKVLFDSGVRQLQINVYSSMERFLELQQWAKELQLETTGSVYTYAPDGTKILSIANKFNVDTRSGEFPDGYQIQNRSGNIPWAKSVTRRSLDKMCVRPFRMLNINWRGDAILCCNDYHGVTNFGNVASKSLVEIWNDDILNVFRFFLQNKQRTALPLCNVCDYNGGVYQHAVNHVPFGMGVNKLLIEKSLVKRRNVLS